MKVKDVMTKSVYTVRPETPLKEVAALLAEHGVSGVPVVDEAGTVLGVVSEADILCKELDRPEHRSFFSWLLGPVAAIGDLKLEARTAAEAMSSPATTIEARKTVTQAATRMLEERVNRLPVVDRDDRLVGIVTRADLVRAFARSDAEIEEEIREDVIKRVLWLDPAQITVTVSHGDVRLDGHVETASEAELLGRFVSRVPGVVSVESDVTWRDREREAARR